MPSRYMKRCSALQIIREMQIKTTMRSHLIPIRMTITKKKKRQLVLVRMHRKGALVHYQWRCEEVYSTMETVWSFLKKIKSRTTIWFSHSTFGYIHRGNDIIKEILTPHVPWRYRKNLNVHPQMNRWRNGWRRIYLYSHLHVEFKRAELTGTESRILVAKAGGWGNGEMLVNGYDLPALRGNFWGFNVQHGDSS